MNKLILRISCLLLIGGMLMSCNEDESPAPIVATESCETILNKEVALHPDKELFQSIIDENTTPESLVGTLALVKDGDGFWMGAAGKANLESGQEMVPCDVGFIASISKVFTAATTYRLIDKGILSIDDPARDYLSAEIVEQVANVKEVTIAQLLSHTSGIPDFITDEYDADRLNSDAKLFTNENILEYIYGQEADFGVGERYSYSNTNFTLLSLILENASGKDFQTLYQEEIFDPLGLSSAYYGEGAAIFPPNVIEGYVDPEDNGNFINSKFLYREELGTGGDGGIAINTYDLAIFFESLLEGKLISSSSLDQMTTYVNIPSDEQVPELGQFQNGFGIEKYDLPFGTALGHTGLIDGFSSFAFYFPETGNTVILINNSASLSGVGSQVSILTEILQIISQ